MGVYPVMLTKSDTDRENLLGKEKLFAIVSEDEVLIPPEKNPLDLGKAYYLAREQGGLIKSQAYSYECPNSRIFMEDKMYNITNLGSLHIRAFEKAILDCQK